MLNQSERLSRSGRVWTLCGVSGVVGLLGSAAAAPAQIFVNTASYSIRGEYGATGSGAYLDINQSDIQQTFGSVSDFASVGADFSRTATGPAASATFSAFLSARADYGSLSVSNSGLLTTATTATNPLANRSAGAVITSSSVLARWQDTITLTGDPPQPGRRARVSGFLELNGEVGISAEATHSGIIFAYGSFIVDLYAPNGSLPTGEYGANTWALAEDNTQPLVGGPPADNVRQPPKLIGINMSLIEGTPFTLDYSLKITGRATAASSVSTLTTSTNVGWFVDLKHTLNWGGITGVTDFVTGEPIENWTMTSASGFDYSQPYREIPEPSSSILLFMGLSSCLGWRWR